MKNQSYIHLICGPMYSGKSSELIHFRNRELVADRSVQIFNYGEDDRYSSAASLASHNHQALPSKAVLSTDELNRHFDESIDTIILDEVQFFDSLIVDFVEYLRDMKSKKVFIAGLDCDFRGIPFTFSDSNLHMGDLMARSDLVKHLSAICTYNDKGGICGEDAYRTQRIIGGIPADYGSDVKLIGAKDSYEARCLEHHFVPGKPEYKF
jgi:thymidine kinase